MFQQRQQHFVIGCRIDLSVLECQFRGWCISDTDYYMKMIG